MDGQMSRLTMNGYCLWIDTCRWIHRLSMHHRQTDKQLE